MIPFPSPLPYVIAATQAATVNQAKGRPPNQPCGILASAADDVAQHLDLDPATVALSIWIARVERANLFVPLRPDAPQWLRSGTVNGFVGITLAWLAQTRPLAHEFGHLFVSSANLTSRPVAVTAIEADSIFDSARLVLDGSPFRCASVPHGSATIIEVRREGQLRVVRDGINNHSLTADHAAYLQVLRNRFATSRATTGREPKPRRPTGPRP